MSTCQPTGIWPLVSAAEFAATFDERWMRESLRSDGVQVTEEDREVLSAG